MVIITQAFERKHKNKLVGIIYKGGFKFSVFGLNLRRCCSLGVKKEPRSKVGVQGVR